MANQPALSLEVPAGLEEPDQAPPASAGAFRRAPRPQRRRGLLVEDEAMTAAATLIQEAFRGLLATLFYAICSATHDVLVYGRENISGHHPSILISNHKRDMDSMVLLGITYFARGISHPNRRLVFALREDAFWPGFLGQYLPNWRGLVSWIDVGPHLLFGKAFPMGHLHGRRELRRIRGQISRFAWLLDHGRDLFWTPEGGLGLDGHFGRFRAGLFRVVQESRAELNLVPIAVFYDFMTTLRTRCFVRIGPEQHIDRAIGRQQFEQQAREAILRQITVNVGHLAATIIHELPPHARLSRAELEQRLRDCARRYRSAGLALDPRLTSGHGFHRRAGQFLAYAQRQGILRHEGCTWCVAQGEQHPAIAYAFNEISEVSHLLDP